MLFSEKLRLEGDNLAFAKHPAPLGDSWKGWQRSYSSTHPPKNIKLHRLKKN